MLGLSKVRDAFDQAVYKLFGYPTARLLYQGEIKRVARGLLADYYARHPEFEPKPLEDPPQISDCASIQEYRQLRREKRLDNYLHQEIKRLRRDLASNAP
jgi:hypothetical protein